MKETAVHNLYKSYAGKTAVKDLTLYVNHAEILGLIEPNGVCKCSTKKMILDLKKTNSGESKISGYQVKEASKNQIDYPPRCLFTAQLFSTLMPV